MHTVLLTITLLNDNISMDQIRKAHAVYYHSIKGISYEAEIQNQMQDMTYLSFKVHWRDEYHGIIEKIRTKNGKKEEKSRLHIINRKYVFLLNRSPDGVHTTVSTYMQPDKSIFDTTGLLSETIFSPICVESIGISELDMKIISIDNTNNEVMCRINWVDAGTNVNHIKGELVVDKSSMLIKRSDIIISKNNINIHKKVSIVYNKIMPCIIREDVAYVNKGNKVNHSTEWKLNNFKYKDIGEHEFTLSAFGLPEPHGITWERPTPWWIYFGLIGGGCLVGFVLIGVFLRRRYGAS